MICLERFLSFIISFWLALWKVNEYFQSFTCLSKHASENSSIKILILENVTMLTQRKRESRDNLHCTSQLLLSFFYCTSAICLPACCCLIHSCVSVSPPFYCSLTFSLMNTTRWRLWLREHTYYLHEGILQCINVFFFVIVGIMNVVVLEIFCGKKQLFEWKRTLEKIWGYLHSTLIQHMYSVKKLSLAVIAIGPISHLSLSWLAEKRSLYCTKVHFSYSSFRWVLNQ